MIVIIGVLDGQVTGQIITTKKVINVVSEKFNYKTKVIAQPYSLRVSDFYILLVGI